MKTHERFAAAGTSGPKGLSATARLLIAAGATLLALSAEAINVPLMQDTFVSSLAPTTNYARWTSFNVNRATVGLLAFDIGSVLPPATKQTAVQKASLTLFVEWLDAPGSVEVVRVLSPFNEDTVTYQTIPTRMGPGSGHAVPMVGSVRPVVVDVTDMVKAALNEQSTDLKLGIQPAMGTPNVAVQFGTKDGHRSAQLDITLVPGAAPLTTYWATSDGSACSTVCQFPHAAMAIADESGAVCKAQDGTKASYVIFVPQSLLNAPPAGRYCGTYRAGGAVAQCYCALP